MRRSDWYRWLATAVVLLAVFCPVAEAVEECRRFLEGLRERGYYDLAIVYLEQMRNSPLADAEFKEVIDYEAGVTLKQSARTGRGRKTREKQLGEARKSFKKFLAEHADHPLAAGANNQLANLLVERGKILAEQAADPKTLSEEKKALTEEARTLYKEAEQVFIKLEAHFSEENKKFPKLLKDPKQTEARRQVRRNLLEVRLFLGQMLEEMAKTYAPGSDDHKKHLEAAAEKFQKLHEKYPDKLAGYYARMWEGRCYRDLGKPDQAFEVFEDLLSAPSEAPSYRVMKTKALLLLVETALAEKRYDKAAVKTEEWEAGARGQDETSVAGLAVKYTAAKASFEQSRELQKDPEKKDEATDALNRSRKWLKYVADRPGEHQKEAKAMLRRKEFAGEDVEIPEPTNYVEAHDRAKDAFELMQDQQLQPDEVTEARSDSLKYYRMAIRMKPDDVDAEEINVIRYRMAYLYWHAGDVPEAAVLGEFLARRCSESLWARPGAMIALAAHARMFNEASGDDRELAGRNMVGMARFVTQRWAGEPEADDAWMTLIGASLRAGDLKSAQEYLAKISPESPRRGQAELMTGQRLWGAYLDASRKEGAERPDQAKLDAMIEQARQTLRNGIERARKQIDEEGAEITDTLVASVLSLAQISIGVNDPDEAVRWLEDPKIGALTLTKEKHPVTGRANFRVEAYKAALRAYVGSQRAAKLADAEEVMKELEELVNQDADAGSTLTRIYISLGRELQNQLERLRNEKKTEQLAKVSEGFEKFLDRISQRNEGNTFSSLNWVAETFHGLGKGFDSGLKDLPPQARKYYEKAGETYTKILDLCAEKKIECPPGAIAGIRLRQARCQLRMANDENGFRAVKAVLLEILAENPTMVDAQAELARTYQQWGRVQPQAYSVAIKGVPALKSGKNKVKFWGWGGLSRKLYGIEKYLALFHDARYNLALCRFEYAKTRKSASDKKKALRQAEKDITVVQRQFPAMGGEVQFKKYDELLKQIQRLRGVKPNGLKPATPAKKTNSTR